MTRKLTNNQKKKIQQIKDNLDHAVKTRAKIGEHRLTELVQRASINADADGYPSSSGFGGKVSGSGSGNSSTETAALDESKHYDPVKHTLDETLRLAHIVSLSMDGIHNGLSNLEIKEKQQRGRGMSDPCLLCLELPSEKGGWCTKDYNNWHDFGKPDRALWTFFHHQTKNSEGDLLVPECPKPSEGSKARRGPWATK